jgi:hypothetical protein
LTREEQITFALKLLAPQPRNHAEYLHGIIVAIDRVPLMARAMRSFKRGRSKEGKKRLEKYRAALRRVQSAYRGLGLLRPWFALPEGIEREIAKSTEFLAQRSRPSGAPDASTKKAAVLAAQDLLWGLGEDVVCTRDGKWAELSIILAGDLDLDLFDHMLAAKQATPPTHVKVSDARDGSTIKFSLRRGQGLK